MVGDRDKAKMRRLSQAMAAGETDERGTPEQRHAFLDLINADRQRHGMHAIDERPPEEGLYERARSLGMARVDR